MCWLDDDVLRRLTRLAAVALLAVTGYLLLRWSSSQAASGQLGIAVGLGLTGLAALLSAAVLAATTLSKAAASFIAGLVLPSSACSGAARAVEARALVALIRERRYESAIEVCEQMAERRPDDPGPYVKMLEIAAYRLNDRQRVDALYRRGQQLLRSAPARDHLATMYEFVVNAPGPGGRPTHGEI